MGYFKKEFPNVEEGDGEGGGNKFLKASDFRDEGITLKFKGLDKAKSNNSEYGANEADYLFKAGLLDKGETFEYKFEDADGNEKIHSNKSAVLFISMRNLDPAIDDVIHISRTGEGKNTKYEVKPIN